MVKRMRNAEGDGCKDYSYIGGFSQRNIFGYPVTAQDYVIYVDDLSWLEDHQERLQVIRSAAPDENIRIIINSPGGALHIAAAYVNAIAESSATIVTHAEGNVCSAGTILWLASEKRTVSPLTVFMFHNYQGGTWGDGANMHSQILFEKEFFDRLIGRFYKNLLTEEEINRIQGGGQVWMDEVQILERTDACLLDKENILRYQKGEAMRQGENIPPATEGLERVVKLTVNLDGKKFVLEANNIEEKILEKLSTDNLFEVAVQIGGLAGYNAYEDLPEEDDRNSRALLIDRIQEYGREVARVTLAREE